MQNNIPRTPPTLVASETQKIMCFCESRAAKADIMASIPVHSGI